MESSLSLLPGLGPKTISKLQKLNIHTPQDLLYHLPSDYIDFSHVIPISQACVNQNSTITGHLDSFQNIYTRLHKNIQRAVVSDSTGKINLIWFNQPYLSKIIIPGQTYSFSGSVSLYQNQKTIVAPEHGQYHTGKIIAKYPETKGLTSKWFRQFIQKNIQLLLAGQNDSLPSSVIKKFRLLSKSSALLLVHCPTDFPALESARLRLAIDEILALQSSSYLQKKHWLSQKPQHIFSTDPNTEKILKQFIQSLPFQLTASQTKVWLEIKSDLTSTTKVTNRLLQGDVGSGKTVIALLACYLAHLNNSLSVIVAPTEILAQQHQKTFVQFLQSVSIDIHLLTTNSKLNLTKIKPNSIIVSTHAIFYKNQKLLQNLGLLIIDEQHKFGVKQRSLLASTLRPPHSITMTATPIPRTVSLTMLGNLDLSVIDQLPSARLPIKTHLVPVSKQVDCYRWIDSQIKNQQQAFFVCPFIEISETMDTVKSAKEEFVRLQAIFPHHKLALIHGRLESKERQKIIDQFQKNNINILVTTPIIEVGIDIPNATIMVIQSADRFGLAQLHQLRGRVGRGSSQSYCFLFGDSTNEKAIKRLQFVTTNTDGLKISEYDLQARGPGQAFSLAQHGFPSLKLANLSNLELINQSQQILQYLISKCPNYDLHLLCHPTTQLTSLPVAPN